MLRFINIIITNHLNTQLHIINKKLLNILVNVTESLIASAGV